MGRVIAVFMPAMAALVLLLPRGSLAGYPMISGLQNVILSPGQSSGTIVFQVSDDRTGPDNLVLQYSSNNDDLVPEDDDHITLGGRGANRTVVVTPAAGRKGQATITLTVTDTDGESNQDEFSVEVVAPPNR